jgi:His-Xaa-Ser system radical SAM maturase HxsB
MKNQSFATIPFNKRLIKNKYLVSNVLGRWDFLDREEFKIFQSFQCKKGTPLYKRLYERGLVVDEKNLKNLIEDYKNLNSNLFNDTSLHIAVVTTRCNLRCGYCQTKTAKERDMSEKVAVSVLENLFTVRNRFVTLEFQGGEPLMNWKVLSFLIERARKVNLSGKYLRLALISNLTLLDDKKMKFLCDFDVDICCSLDGPRGIHDENRVFKNGSGSYGLVMEKVKVLEERFGKKISFLPTITKKSLDSYKEIIDEYVRLGQTSIALRPVNRLGSACLHWQNVGYPAEEFIQFYIKAMEYILKLNKEGVFIKERVTCVILEKLFNSKDPVYTELMNPCGAGRAQVVYMPDGSCYPCDEARMAKDDIFKLGNILEEDYESLMKKDNLFHLLQSSVINLWDYSSVFSPWTGTCPVVNYIMQNNLVPKIWSSPVHKINNAQFEYIFEKILSGGRDYEILKSWTKVEVVDEEKKT